MVKVNNINWGHFIAFSFCFFMFFIPDYLVNTFPLLSTFFDYLRIIVFLVLYFYSLIFKNNVKLSLPLVLIPILYFILLCVTLYYKGPYLGVITEFFRVYAPFFFIFLFYSIDAYTLSYSLSTLLFIFLMLNTISIFLYPNGMYVTISQAGWLGNESWFLGFKNGFASYIFLSIASFYFLFKTCNKKTSLYIFLILVNIANCLLISFLSSSSTCLFSVLFFIFTYILLKETKKFPKRHQLFFYRLIFYIIFAVSVLFLIFPSDSLISIVANLFNKDSYSLLSRVSIWDNTKNYVFMSPIFGFGNESSLIIVDKIGQINSHNTLLWITYRGGFISLFIFLTLIIKLARYHLKNRSPVECSILLAIIIMCTTEVMINPMISALIALLFNIKKDSLYE